MKPAPLPAWLTPTVRRVDLGSREGRIQALGELAQALLEGKDLDRETTVFVGSALRAWLSRGGSLERDFLKVAAPAGSHRTPAWVWSSSSRGQQESSEADSLGASFDERNEK